jgi:hypothetical protein
VPELKEAVLKVRAELESGVTVRPGDRLLVRVTRPLSPEMARQLRAWLREELPGVEILIVDGVDQMLVYRPKAGTTTPKHEKLTVTEEGHGTAEVVFASDRRTWAWRCDGRCKAGGWIGSGHGSNHAAEQEARQHLRQQHDTVGPHSFVPEQPCCVLFIGPNTVCGRDRDDPLHREA